MITSSRKRQEFDLFLISMVSEWVLQDYLRQVVLVLWVYPSCVTVGGGNKRSAVLSLYSKTDESVDPHKRLADCSTHSLTVLVLTITHKWSRGGVAAVV